MSVYPATNSNEAVELIIDAANQIHQVINETADKTVTTESGEIPSVRKAIADSLMFLEPLPWKQGESETNFLQIRSFNSELYWAPSATASTPKPMGVSPIGDTNWKLAPLRLSKSSILSALGKINKGFWDENPKLENEDDFVVERSTGNVFGAITLPYQVNSATHPDPNVLVGTDLVDVSKFASEDYVLDKILAISSLEARSVADMLNGKTVGGESLQISSGQTWVTSFNGLSEITQKWNVVSSEPTTGYWIQSGSLYFDLQISSSLNLAGIGWDSSLSSSEVAGKIHLGCEIARRTPQLSKIEFPAGTYDCDDFIIDIDRRGFHVSGAGKDLTTLVNKSINGVSMLVTRIDPRNRSRDKLHDYLTIDGFTIDGDITNRGAQAASRAVIQANYAEIDIKSVGHIDSNLDINGLVSKHNGHTEGRKNGATFTKASLRLRNNAIKCLGNCYTNGEASEASSRAFVCNDGATETTSTFNAGDLSITVKDASGLDVHDRIEIGTAPTVDVLYVTNKNVNTLTLDGPLVNNHPTGAPVKLPVISDTFEGTIETGLVDINNAIAFNLRATYQEESRVLLRGLLPAFTMSGGSNAQVSPSVTIDNVDRLSSINIENNDTKFSIVINLFDRGGGQTQNLDLYNMPELSISGNTRAESRININGVKFNWIDVTRNYNYTIGDRYQTDFKFGGLFASADAGAVTVTALGLYMNASQAGFDAYNFEITSSCRRANSSGLKAGIMKRIGGVSTDGNTASTDTVKVATSYQYSSDNGNRVDINLSGSVNTATIRCQGENGGGDTTYFVLNGQVSHLL